MKISDLNYLEIALAEQEILSGGSSISIIQNNTSIINQYASAQGEVYNRGGNVELVVIASNVNDTEQLNLVDLVN